MKWNNVREQYPDKWLLFLDAESYVEGERRIIEELAPIQAYVNYYDAWRHYRRLHEENPTNRYFVYHTSNDEIVIKLQKWIGVRGR